MGRIMNVPAVYLTIEKVHHSALISILILLAF